MMILNSVLKLHKKKKGYKILASAHYWVHANSSDLSESSLIKLRISQHSLWLLTEDEDWKNAPHILEFT